MSAGGGTDEVVEANVFVAGVTVTATGIDTDEAGEVKGELTVAGVMVNVTGTGVDTEEAGVVAGVNVTGTGVDTEEA